MSLTCKVCGKRAYSEYCVSHKPRKPIKQGKQAKAWQEFRRHYITLNPPEDDGYYRCIIPTCGALMLPNEVTVDHAISRSRAPHLRYNEENMNFMCFFHNGDKGSRSLDEYIEYLQNKR